MVADTPDSHPALPGGPVVTFQVDQRGRRAGPGPDHVVGEAAGSPVAVPTPFGTTRSSCPTSTLEATKKIQPTVIGRPGDPSVDGGKQRRAGAVRLAGRVRPAVRRRRPGRRRPAQPSCRRSSRTTSGPSASACSRKRRQPCSIQGTGDSCRHHVRPQFTLAPSPVTLPPTPIGRRGVRPDLASPTRPAGGDYRSGAPADFIYQNTFTCIPAGVPFRPPGTTPKPSSRGRRPPSSSARTGEEIFTDKYGRVKVQFHWDREGKNDADSSCWVRVGQLWAGKRWGAFLAAHRPGGDRRFPGRRPRPADHRRQRLQRRPDAAVPRRRARTASTRTTTSVSGMKSNTTPGGVGFNEWRFDDTKGKEQVFIHAEKDMDLRVKNDRRELVMHDTHLIVGCGEGWQKGRRPAGAGLQGPAPGDPRQP